MTATAVPAISGTHLGDIATSGPLLLAIPVALIAGIVSFLSPCMLPLVPGYLSYITGLSGRTLGSDPSVLTSDRRRVLAGSVLFVLGFSVVFVATGSLFGGLGALLYTHAIGLQRIAGAFVILLAAAFLGWLPMLNRQARLPWRPAGSVAAAPLLGAVFALGWTPCIGPTLAAVLTLAAGTGTAGRGALLAGVYSLGLGLPFIAVGLGLRRTFTALAFIRRRQRLVVHVGGALLLLTGILLVTGVWNTLMIQLRVWVSSVALPV